MSALNPPVVLKAIPHPKDESKIFMLCDDGVSCIGGTKQRVLSLYVPSLLEEEIVMVATPNGLAQVALALTTKSCGKKATVFLVCSKDGPENALTQLARQYGADIRYQDEDNVSVHSIVEMGKAYVAQDPKNRHLVPPGLKSPPESTMYKCFQAAMIESLLHVEPPKRLWIVCGSCFLCNVLHSIWPACEFMMVLADLTLWHPEEVLDRNHQLFFCTQKFHEIAPLQPPYETVPWYDAKLWEFVLKHGQNGDYIWNVGKCPTV